VSIARSDGPRASQDSSSGAGPEGRELSNFVVAAVSPLSETQTLDLASSQRRIDELSIALAVALRQQGATGQAEALEQ
jgi:hypothetical protein